MTYSQVEMMCVEIESQANKKVDWDCWVGPTDHWTEGDVSLPLGCRKRDLLREEVPNAQRDADILGCPLYIAVRLFDNSLSLML